MKESLMSENSTLQSTVLSIERENPGLGIIPIGDIPNSSWSVLPVISNIDLYDENAQERCQLDGIPPFEVLICNPGSFKNLDTLASILEHKGDFHTHLDEISSPLLGVRFKMSNKLMARGASRLAFKGQFHEKNQKMQWFQRNPEVVIKFIPNNDVYKDDAYKQR